MPRESHFSMRAVYVRFSGSGTGSGMKTILG